MKKEKLISYLALIGIALALPGIVYIVKSAGNIAGYSREFTFFEGDSQKIIGAVIFAWSVILMFCIYLKLIKKSDEFKTVKSILITALIVGLVFAIILPNTSADVFFYMGNGRLIDKYHQNPYITSVSQIESLNDSDDVLKTVGLQSDYTFVYGPLFLTICGLLNKISFSSVLIFLYEFKFLNFVAYLFTIYLIYKLTHKKKFAVLFAFNPLVLLEVLVNVHNDIFVLLFAFLGILFVKEAEKCRKSFIKSELIFISGTVFFALSAAIKYITFLIIPFVIIYRLRNEKWLNKIVIGTVYMLVFLGIFFGLYIPYFENPLMAFSGAIAQSGKLKDSIYLIIAIITKQNSSIISTTYSIGFFILFYIFIVRVLMQAFKKNTFKKMMENSFTLLLALIFLGLTNLTSWYLLWLFLPVFWTSGKKMKNFIWLGFFYELTYTIFFPVHYDLSSLQVWVLPFIAMCMLFFTIKLKKRQ